MLYTSVEPVGTLEEPFPAKDSPHFDSVLYHLFALSPKASIESPMSFDTGSGYRSFLGVDPLE